MSKKTYWELLKDPRWQQMRLRVMEREDFKCQECKDDKSTLNVHHTYYEKGNAPWEYPSASLRCLCESCHEEAEILRAQLSMELFGMPLWQQRRVGGYARALAMDWDSKLSFRCFSADTVSGMVDFRLSAHLQSDSLYGIAEVVRESVGAGHITNHLLSNAVEQAKAECEGIGEFIAATTDTWGQGTNSA